MSEASAIEDVYQQETAEYRAKGINQGTVSGIVHSSELTNSGSIELKLTTDTTKVDNPIKGKVDEFFTSTLFIRVPKVVVTRLGVEAFAPGTLLMIETKLTGVRRALEGEIFDSIEIKAKDVFPLKSGDTTDFDSGFNNFTLSGRIDKVDMKKSGSAEVWLNTDTERQNTPLKGATVTSYHTSTLFIRVPKPVVKKSVEELKEGNHIIIPSRAVGKRRILLGKEWYVVELTGLRVEQY